MADRGGNEGVIKVNSFCSHRGKDWLNHRDTGFITIPDSSDEELPLLLKMPENQQPEEGDGDVILAENAWPQPAHPPEDTGRQAGRDKEQPFQPFPHRALVNLARGTCQNKELLGWSRTSLRRSSDSSKVPRCEEELIIQN